MGVCLCARACVRVRMCVWVCVYVCLSVCVYVCAHVCACVCTCARERVSHSCIVRTQCVKQTILQTTYSTIHHPVWSWKVDV